MMIKNTTAHTDKKRRELLRQVSRLGVLFLAQSGFVFAASMKPEKKISSTKTGESTTDKAAFKNPERLVTSDVVTTSPIDHRLFNPSTKRKIGVRIRLPRAQKKTGLVIYSPGLGSGLNNGAPWCDAWCHEGFVVVTLSHPVTNEDIWDVSKQSLKSNLRDALAFSQYGLRVTDCKFVIDVFLADPYLKDIIDSELVGIAGHSYGALTVQSIAGQSKGISQADPRIKAAIAFSPTAMSPAAANSMKTVKIPFFCITGDHDNHVTFKNDIDSMRLGVELSKRKFVYKGLPPGKREQLVLANADHMSFAGENLHGAPLRFSRDINATIEQDQHTWEKISRITTLFWQTHLRKNTTDTDLTNYREALRQRLGKEDEYTVD
jgi:predicted dienelactone hydrolase